MNVKVKYSYKTLFPRDIGKMVEKILLSIPQQYTMGLDSIVLVDRIVQRKCRNAIGIYVARGKEGLPYVEVAVQTLYGEMPRFFFYIPFIAEFLLTNVIYHEIGHHYQTISRMPKKIKIESNAEVFNKMMWKEKLCKLGLFQRFFLHIFLWIVSFVARKKSEEEIIGNV